MSEKYRFHVPGLAHASTNLEFLHCAYSQKVRKLCRMLREAGHEVYHYGRSDADPVCSERVTVLTMEDWARSYGQRDITKEFFTFDQNNDHAYKVFDSLTIAEIHRRKQPGDFLLCSWGWGHKRIADAHEDLRVVEPGIGYGDTFAPYKAFESYAIYHSHCGRVYAGKSMMNWREVVIPNYFDVSEFEYREQKGDYFLHLGRLFYGKGTHIACQLAECLGFRLILAGQNYEAFLKEFYPNGLPANIEFVGCADLAQRRELMAGARGLIIPAQYCEPFGGVQIEAMLSGTPVISSDWGAYAEYNLHGRTGWRCRTFEQYAWAIQHADQIKPRDCREWGLGFSTEAIAPKFEEYWGMIARSEGDNGWYRQNPERKNLDWLQQEPVAQAATNPDAGKLDFARMAEEEGPFAERLAAYLDEEWIAREVYDFGCGPGHFVAALLDRGLIAQGYDIKTDAPNCHNRDLRERLNWLPVELVLCLEVAEHIAPDKIDGLLQNIWAAMKPGGRLLWSAAQPGQGGVDHINCQPPSYWRKRLTDLGLLPLDDVRERLVDYIRRGPHMGWFVNNAQVFFKPTK